MNPDGVTGAGAGGDDDAGAGAAPDVRASDLERSALLARLPGVSLLELTVARTAVVSPALRRISFHGDSLAGFEYQPGQDLMFSVPQAGTGRLDSDPAAEAPAFRRRYTIRRIDRVTSELDIDVVVHGDGPGARWARSVATGERVEAIGPRGKITLDGDAAWHLMVGDESGLPNAFALTEALPPGARAQLVLEVDGPDDELAVPSPPQTSVSVCWVHRDGAAPGTVDGLRHAVRSVTPPPGQGHAYLTGELGVVAALRAELAGRGMTAAQLSPKAYWRRGVANAAHGEPARD